MDGESKVNENDELTTFETDSKHILLYDFVYAFRHLRADALG